MRLREVRLSGCSVPLQTPSAASVQLRLPRRDLRLHTHCEEIEASREGGQEARSTDGTGEVRPFSLMP